MSYQEHGIEHREPNPLEFRNFLGYALILCGVAAAVWVIINVYGLFTDPAKLTPFQQLVAANLETTIAQADKEAFKLVIPAEVLSYFIPLFLLVIAAQLAGLLITNGVRLLCGSREKPSGEKPR